MKRFTLPVSFEGESTTFPVYIGEPTADRHPLHFQAAWMAELAGGQFPAEILRVLDWLQRIARENGRSFEELCTLALGANRTDPLSQDPVELLSGVDALSRLVVLVHGVGVGGVPFWSYVAIRPSMYADFLRGQERGQIDLNHFDDFGEVLLLGEGDNPPDEVRQGIVERCGREAQWIYQRLS